MIRFIIYSLALFITLLPAFASGNGLRIVTTHFPPYVFIEDGMLKGLHVNLLYEIFKRMEVSFTIELLPWPRALQMLKNGNADAMFPLFKTKERMSFIDYSNPLFTEETALFALKDKGTKFTTLADLSGCSFGSLRGFSYGTKLDDFIRQNNITVDFANSAKQNVEKFVFGRFDILVEARYVPWYELQKLDRWQDVAMLDIIAKNQSHLGFSKKRNHQQLISRYNSVLKSMKEDGSYEKIVAKYFFNSDLYK